MSQSIHASVDLLLLEQGEYLPLELLLQEGRLAYADYELWRNGELPVLEDALFGDPRQIVELLEQAEQYLQRRGWQAETLRYTRWSSELVSPEHHDQALTFSTARLLNEVFHRRYSKPQDQPQLDLFTDSPATSLANGIVQSLIDRNPGDARRMLDRLADMAPDHARLGEFERLTEAVETQNAPARDPRAELQHLQGTLTPLADSVLGSSSRHLLIPLWRRLSQALQGHPYHAGEPELHLSFSASQSLDWPVVRRAVEDTDDWQSHAPLLHRHATACDREHDFANGLGSWFNLCWQFADQAGALATSRNSELREQWRNFQDLDPEIPVSAFPSWLLLMRPGLTRTLTPPAADTRTVCPASYCAVYALQQHRTDTTGVSTDVALRAELQEADPELFRIFLETIRA